MVNILKPITIEEEYVKNPDISPEDIKKLRDWLKTQPHLPGDLLTDVDLMIVFHCCDKSQEVSKQVLDLHFTLKTMFQMFFKDRAFDKKAEFHLNTILPVPLPTSTLQGHRAAYVRLLDPEPKNFNFVESVRVILMLFEMWQYEEGTFPGFCIIIDMDQTCVGHLLRLEPATLKKALYYLQECLLTKLCGVHFINAPYFMDKLISLLKPFIKKELIDLLFIHEIGSDSIYKILPKEAFPKEEGGNYKDHITLRDENIDRLRANHVYLREENKRRVNESLRKGKKPSSIEEEFGIQGSFKKLDID